MRRAPRGVRVGGSGGVESEEGEEALVEGSGTAKSVGRRAGSVSAKMAGSCAVMRSLSVWGSGKVAFRRYSGGVLAASVGEGGG